MEKPTNEKGNQIIVLDKNSIALAVHNPTPGTKAIDLRRKMIQLPEVAQALTDVEKFVFVASTKIQIAEIDDQTLVSKTKQMFKFIALDVGYRVPNDSEEWAYITTRLFTVLKRYYSQLTLAEIKLAFELAATGDLDEFLPRLSSGEADKNHYQQFNADYFCKILNAYKAKQSSVFTKAKKALPEPENKISPEQAAKYHNSIVDACKTAFLKYKYFGRFELKALEYMFVYDWLLKFRLADEVEANKEDREAGYYIYLKRISEGHGSKWNANQVRKEGIYSKMIDFTVFEIARDKEIRRAFDEMVKDEVYINNYLDYK